MQMTKELYNCPANKICPTAILEWDLFKDKFYFSSHWLKMVGFNKNKGEYSFKNLIDSIHPEDRQIVKDNFEKIRHDGEKVNFSYRVKFTDESFRWMNLVITVSKYEYDMPAKLVAIQQDINDFMEAQSFLSEINIKFRKLVENFSGAILMEDEHRKVFYTNNDFLKLFNISLSTYQLIGTDCASSVEQVKQLFDDPEQFNLSIETAIKNKVPVYGEIFKMKNGIILERDYVPVSDNLLEKGHLWLYRDITRLKRNEEELEFRLGFEELINNLSSKFINIEWTNIDLEIDEALEFIGTFIKADRSYIFLFNEDSSLMNNTHEWAADGISREKDNLQNVPTELFPWWMDKLNKNESFYIPSVQNLTEDLKELKDILEPQGIKSMVIVPLAYKSKPIGFCGFDSVVDYRVWTEDSIKILNVAGGVITAALKRKESEEALSKSEERYKLISHLIADYAIAYTVDKDKNVFVEWTTESFKNFFDIYPRKTYTFEEFNNIIFSDDIEYVYKQRKKLEFSAYVTSEFRVVTKTGRVRWIKEYGLSEITGKGEGKKYHLAAQDITETKMHQEKLSNERNLLRTIIDNIPDPIYVKDLEGKKILVNNAELQVLGAKSMNDVIGKKDSDFYPPNISENTMTEDKRVMETGVPLINEEGFVITKSGETKWFIGNKIPFHDSAGKVRGLVGVSYNITQRKEAEQETKNALQKEKELNEMKSKFVSMVSHEFRTPLAAILSSSDLLELYWEKWTVEKRNSLLVKIKKSIKDLIEILNDVTEINRVDSGKATVNLEEVDLVGFVGELIEELKAGYEDHPEIQFVKSDQTIPFKTDKKLLRQIAVNLLSNAIKYTPKEKNVYISLQKENNEISFTVKDEGIGIPEEDYNTLFEPFMRCKNAGKIKGTGLGLSILKRAVDLLNANISFNSIINIGSTFSVSFPVTKER